MPPAATRYLYLARHGEALPDESGLSDTGRQQATLLGCRLRARPISAVHHGPLPRALQTARLVGEQLDGVSLTSSTAAGDYVPYVPDRPELPTGGAEVFLRFLEPVTAEEAAVGRELAEQATEHFTGPVAGDTDRHGLVITHNFLIAWLVRQALGLVADLQRHEPSAARTALDRVSPRIAGVSAPSSTRVTRTTRPSGVVCAAVAGLETSSAHHVRQTARGPGASTAFIGRGDYSTLPLPE